MAFGADVATTAPLGPRMEIVAVRLVALVLPNDSVSEPLTCAIVFGSYAGLSVTTVAVSCVAGVIVNGVAVAVMNAPYCRSVATTVYGAAAVAPVFQLLVSVTEPLGSTDGVPSVTPLLAGGCW